MRILLTTLALLLPLQVSAAEYDTSHLPYSDAPQERSAAVAISTLTELGILEGYADGTIRAGVPLNRAEFLKIVMGLLPDDKKYVPLNCFPDVDPNVWFARPVCRAKDMGIVHGNAVDGVPADKWLFEPARAVKYEEALKILARIYGIPLVEAPGGEWYETYVKTAYKLGIDLKDSAPGSSLTRGQMARVTVAFRAYANGDLEDLRIAEGTASSRFSSSRTSASSVSSATSSSSSSSTSSSSSRSSSSSLAVIDDLAYDTSLGDSILVLGKVTRVLGAAKIFSNTEPILIDTFIIDLENANTSVSVFNVYDHDGVLLGRATLDTSYAGNVRYRLNVSLGTRTAPKREEFSFYARAVMKAQDAGGVSGTEVQVDRMGIMGVGEWSTRSYEQYTSSSETFARSQTARASITSVTNAGGLREALVPGPAQEIGAFRFAGVTGHSAADLRVTDIAFQIEQTGITLTNAYMRVDGSSQNLDCTISGSQLLCEDLPETFGSLKDSPRTLRIYADVTANIGTSSLRLTINNPGSIGSPGAITWTDGVTTFTWVESDTQPVVRGTYYTY